jgi:hypothetical protein
VSCPRQLLIEQDFELGRSLHINLVVNNSLSYSDCTPLVDEKGEVSPAVIGDIWQAVAHDLSSRLLEKSESAAFCALV